MKRQAFQLSCALAAAFPLLIATPVPAPAAEKAAEPCKAQPHDQGQSVPGASTSGENRLGDCNGVLHPPATGDPDMVKPAPDVGELRVVPPDAVPQNNGNGAGGQPEKTP